MEQTEKMLDKTDNNTPKRVNFTCTSIVTDIDHFTYRFITKKKNDENYNDEFSISIPTIAGAFLVDIAISESNADSQDLYFTASICKITKNKQNKQLSTTVTVSGYYDILKKEGWIDIKQLHIINDAVEKIINPA